MASDSSISGQADAGHELIDARGAEAPFFAMARAFATSFLRVSSL
jgi:hypothetical protein